jgi:hypothetical protein
VPPRLRRQLSHVPRKLLDARAFRLNELHVPGNLFLRLHNDAFARFHGGIHRLQRPLPLAAHAARQLVHALRRLLHRVDRAREFFAGVQARVQLLHLQLMQPLKVRLLPLAVVFRALQLRSEVLPLRQLANLLRTAKRLASACAPPT